MVQIVKNHTQLLSLFLHHHSQLCLSRARFLEQITEPWSVGAKYYYSTGHCPFHLSCLIGCCSTSLPPKFVAVVVVAGVIVVETVPDSPP